MLGAMDTPASRLRTARIAKGYTSASEAARAVGVLVSTYTHHENGTRKFRQKSAEKYARAFGVSASHLLMLADAGSAISHPTVGLPIVSEAAIGVWHESVEKMPQSSERLSVPDRLEWQASNEYAVQVRDRSVDRFIQKDEYAVCRPIKQGPVDTDQFQINDFVHVERIRRGLKEMSIRRVRSKNGAQLRLASYSNDPRIKSEVAFPTTRSGVDQVRILGLVVGKYMRMRQ